MAPHAESPTAEHIGQRRTSESSAHHQPVFPTDYTRSSRRQPRSQAEIAHIRVKNRRREYLDRNPAYFQSAEHEFADPLLYDELVRKFQTPAEREAEGKTKGYGRVLEGSLLRGEARLAQMATEGTAEGQHASGSGGALVSSAGAHAPPQEAIALEAEIVALSTPPTNKQEAAERWQEFLRARFVRGGDEDFEYDSVDQNEDFDTLARRDEEEAWFDDEDPGWASTGADGEERQTRPERVLHGETGVQDY